MEKLYVVVNITPKEGSLAFVAREEEHAKSWALVDRPHAAMEQANQEKFGYPDQSNLEPEELQNLLLTANAEYGAGEYRIFAADMSLETQEFFDEDGDCYCFSKQEILNKLEECEEEEKRKKSRTRR